MPLRIEPGAEPILGYKLIDRIGGGGFGEVWKCEAPGGLLKAIKVVYGDMNTTDADGTKRTEQELKALKRVQSVRHPYLLSLERYDIIDSRLLITMELADRNLWDRWRECKGQGLPGIPREELIRYMEESAEVLDLMNIEYQLQHLDIKPQNIFLVRNHVKVADFGLVKDLEGMMATVTGGITPVYAAPETFDGKVTRFCDQYSLAIVYQELLTGQRPFSGTSLQQLIMQHLSSPPNLTPLPKSDRAVIARALHKKAEGRFPNCTDMVQALRKAELAAQAARLTAPALPSAEEAAAAQSPAPASGAPPADAKLAESPVKPVVPRGEHAPAKQSSGSVVQPEPEPLLDEPARPAPARQSGDGLLFPALVIGLGKKGTEAVQYLRQSLEEHFGSMDNLPHLRLLAMDTDVDSLTAATRAAGGSRLAVNETFPVRLNRPAHYLRVVGGKTMLDGWFNSKLIYRIPRTPETTGLRCLGRLAFVDHYRAIAAKLRAELEGCTRPAAITSAANSTKLGLRSNYPRVYIISSLTGGTGGGMFIDLAYLVRSQLRHLGYAQPEVIGLLLLPQTQTQGTNVLALGNAHAALTELRYYSAADSMFAFRYEGSSRPVKDADPPFNRVLLVPLEVENPKRPTGEAARMAGECLFRHLMTPVGRVSDSAKPPAPEGAVRASFEAFGLYRLTWPREPLLDRTARRLCIQLIERWTVKDAAPVRESVEKWLSQELARQELSAESLISILQETCEKALGHSPESAFAALVEPFVPKGRRDPDIEPDAVREAMEQFSVLLGAPQAESPGQRQAGALVEALEKTGDIACRKWGARLSHMAVGLVENPNFRLRGAEEAIRQLTAILTDIMESHEPVLEELEHDSADAYARIREMLELIESNPGGGRRMAAVHADLGEALREYPRTRYQALLLRRVAVVFTTIRGNLSDQARELTVCRNRLNDLGRTFQDANTSAGRQPTHALNLIPAGCKSLDEAIEEFLGSVEPEAVRALDQQIQKSIQGTYGSLLQICLTSSNVVKSLEELMLQKVVPELAGRLTDMNVVDMFLGHYGEEDAAVGEISNAYNEAVPELARKASPSEPEIRVLALPPGEAADIFRGLLRKALANIPLMIADSADDVVFYREQAGLTMDRLDILGQVGQNAYKQMATADNFSPHSREDITDWTPPAPRE